MFLFTLIQNAASIQQINHYLIHIHNMFKSKYVDEETIFSIKILAQETKNRNLAGLNVMAE